MTDPTTLQQSLDLQQLNQRLATPLAAKDAQSIVEWAAAALGDGVVMTTSFGIQSAVMLHLVTRSIPKIPVIWVDTGYLPAETYRFADRLTQRLQLNLHVYQSPLSPARMEALYGQLWARQDLESLNQYDRIRKVEPLQRALRELSATGWLAGLRADQTSHRQTLDVVGRQYGIYKILPILNWTAKDVYDYLQTYDLPYHPMFDRGYVSVGDWHSSRPLSASDSSERDTRFHGLKQECGLHLPQTPGEAESLDSSSL